VRSVTSPADPPRLTRAAAMVLLSTLQGARVRVVDELGDERLGDTSTSPPQGPAVTVRVHDPRVYRRVLRHGSIGLGESYADGWWDCDDLTGLLRLSHRAMAGTFPILDLGYRVARPFLDPIPRRRRPNQARDRRNVRAHYDLGNQLFEHMLDATMSYSCALFDRPCDSLAAASTRKFDRLAQLLQLQPGDRLLEIGTGWGGFAIHAASRYGCQVTTTTVSQAQYEFATARVASAGLREMVSVRPDDYRDLRGTFDKIVAIEMIEAVDWRDYKGFFAQCRQLLTSQGALVLQAIAIPDQSFDRTKRHTDFVKAAIFPGGCLPSVRALTDAARCHGFLTTSLDDIGLHYAETLRRWRGNLLDARHELRRLGYDDQFLRRWEFYLCYCEAGFEERYLRDVQLLYTTLGWRPHGLLTQPTDAAGQLAVV
jgi:cyclopropane-fatty-acyl-phospholipid synthase